MSLEDIEAYYFQTIFCDQEDPIAAFLKIYLNTDPGAAYVGVFAFGTNNRVDRFIKNILFDEKVGGTFQLALGVGYSGMGSRNKSAIHWDMI